METHFSTCTALKRNRLHHLFFTFHILGIKGRKHCYNNIQNIIFRTLEIQKRSGLKSDRVTQKWKTCLYLLLSWQSHRLCECQRKLNNIHLEAIHGLVSHDYNEFNADGAQNIKVLNQNKTIRKQARKLDDLNMNNSIIKQHSDTAREKQVNPPHYTLGLLVLLHLL